MGDHVFATVWAYPSWPARINNIEIKSSESIYYRVTSFATNKTARCSKAFVWPNQENKVKYGVKKWEI